MPRDCPPGQTATVIATTENKFSVQLNTNQFTTGYGKIGWVQFVLQSTVDQNALCVWKVDVKAQGYERTCTTAVQPAGVPARTFLGPNAARRRGQSMQVLGVIQVANDGTKLLAAMAGAPWVDLGDPFPHLFAVTTTDTISGAHRGLDPNDSTQYPLGLTNNNWFSVSGDLYGYSCGSVAMFEKASFFEMLTASACDTFDPNCQQEPLTPFSLSNFASPATLSRVTGESNNLVPSGLVPFYCPYHTECTRWGGFHAPP